VKAYGTRYHEKQWCNEVARVALGVICPTTWTPLRVTAFRKRVWPWKWKFRAIKNSKVWKQTGCKFWAAAMQFFRAEHGGLIMSILQQNPASTVPSERLQTHQYNKQVFNAPITHLVN